jgi:hypothetical protein
MMTGFSKCVLAVSIMAASIVGCSTEAKDGDAESDAPDIALDTASEADEGDSYNGWSQGIIAYYEVSYGWVNASQTFYQNYGDSSRGGGVCLVQKVAGLSCSSDAVCLTWAKNTYGDAAKPWGYCYAGECYARPGSSDDLCKPHPNRSPANGNMTLDAFTISNTSNWYGLGCMTKTAGPNGACGSEVPSLYMRHVVPVTLWNICDVPGEC